VAPPLDGVEDRGGNMRRPGRDHESAQPGGRRPKLTYANVISTLALFLALGGGAYAAVDAFIYFTPGGKGEACGFMRRGVIELKSYKLTPKVHCPKGTIPLAFNQTGMQGLQGLQGSQGNPGIQGVKGDTGPQGPPSADIWLRADETGHVIASRGVASTNVRGGTGYYPIPVGRDVSHCASVASEDQTSGGGITSNVFVASRIIPSVSTTTVYVNSFDSGGTAKDTGFDVAVYC
jgi:hypothetical protein